MEPFRSHSGSQTAIFLAGCILSCFLQLVPAQENLTVVSVPEHPIQGQSILLKVEKVPQVFEQCEWMSPTGNKITFTSDTKEAMSNTSEVVVYRNCSLTIKNLKSSDQGRHTVKVTLPPTKQQATGVREIYIGSIFLTLCDEKKIRIIVNPSNPRVGQNVVLTPQGIPSTYHLCQWNQKTESGVDKVFQDPGSEPNKQQNQQQKIQKGCSFHLAQITKADSGNYSIYVEVYPEQQSAPGKQNREQMKCYKSQTQIKVTSEISGLNSTISSAGIIAGAFLGSLTWVSSLSLVPLLFGVLSSFFPEC